MTGLGLSSKTVEGIHPPMTSVTRRTVRTTAAIAGIAALGTGLAGAAAALPALDEIPLADALPTGAVPDR